MLKISTEQSSIYGKGRRASPIGKTSRTIVLQLKDLKVDQ